MAKKNRNLKNKQEEEYLADEDFSSNEIEVYKPTKEDEDKELNLDEEAYNLIEYIELEWPSQSIDICDSRIYIGTSSNDQKANENGSLIEINLSNTNFQNLKWRKSNIGKSINKIRIMDYIFVLDDTSLAKYDLNFNLLAEQTGHYGHAMFLTEKEVFVGTVSGNVECYDHQLNKKFEFKIHEKAIEAIGYENGMIFTGSSDHSLKISKVDGSLIDEIKLDSDVNCLDVRNGKVVYGDDKGVIGIYDVNDRSREVIEWHTSSISLIRWRDNEIFASGSDEQLCLWDITLEEDPEIDFNKYLLFVHQGQKFYKDCCFEESKVICTSQDGICIFEPISLVSQ